MKDIKVGDFIKWNRPGPGGHVGEGFVSKLGTHIPEVVAVDVTNGYGGKEWVYASDVYYKVDAPKKLDIKVGDTVEWWDTHGAGKGRVAEIMKSGLVRVVCVDGDGDRHRHRHMPPIDLRRVYDAPKTPDAPDDYHAKKFDGGKSRMDLLPWAALVEVGRVLEYGCRKYAEDSWQDVPDARKRYLAAMFRHAAAIQDGEDIDPESGLHHAAHMACNALFVCWLTLKGK